MQERWFQMKLQNLVLAAVTAFSTLAQAREVRQLVCQGANSFSYFRITEGTGAMGHITYNYSTAEVVCSYSFENVLNKSSIARCYGSWSFDIDRANGALIDSLAWVEITNNGKKITAQTQTNRVYGSKRLNMNCTVEKIQLPEGQ